MRGQFIKNKKVFSNTKQTYTAYCGVGFTGSSVGIVEANEIKSVISLDDANTQALQLAMQRANNALICVPAYGYAAYFLPSYVCVKILQ